MVEMSRFEIRIKTTKGTEIRAKIVAQSQHLALWQFMNNFRGGLFLQKECTDICSVEIEEIGEAKSIDEYRFTMARNGKHVACLDLDNRLALRFELGDFEHSQRLTDLRGKEVHIENADDLAGVMYDFGEYLTQYQKELIS